jgi:uncharacterized membrane protein YgaE (UPF0421/DUF939 family)
MKQLSGAFDPLQESYTKQYDLDGLVDAYAKKWADTKQAIAHQIDAPAQREQDHLQRHADTEDAIRQIHATLMDHLNEHPPSIEIIRDESGRASAIRKGDRLMTIERGPNGRATGLK